MDEVTLNAKAVLRKAMELILSDHQQQYGGKSDQSGYLFGGRDATICADLSARLFGHY